MPSSERQDHSSPSRSSVSAASAGVGGDADEDTASVGGEVSYPHEAASPGQDDVHVGGQEVHVAGGPIVPLRREDLIGFESPPGSPGELTPLGGSESEGEVDEPAKYIYEGDKDGNGAPHGIGRCMYVEGAVYEGEWWHGQAHGKGVFTYPSGARWVNASCSFFWTLAGCSHIHTPLRRNRCGHSEPCFAPFVPSTWPRVIDFRGCWPPLGSRGRWPKEGRLQARSLLRRGW